MVADAEGDEPGQKRKGGVRGERGGVVVADAEGNERVLAGLAGGERGGQSAKGRRGGGSERRGVRTCLRRRG